MTAFAGSAGSAGCSDSARTGTWTPGSPRPFAIPDRPTQDLQSLASNEGFWDAVRKNYTIDDSITNLEYGYFGRAADHVEDTFFDKSMLINSSNSHYMRGSFDDDADQVRARVAQVAGVGVDEIALTRGATEALQLLIANYNKLRPGDEVLYADLDYDSMQYAMSWLQDRRGVRVRTIAIPEPATHDSVMDAYRSAFRDFPATKLVLTTHLSHRTGLVMPIAEITELAQAHGADVVVDAAHSWGQIPFELPDLKAPFIGLNLHKWMGAPLGCGVMYIRKDRLGDIDRDLADEDYDPDDIRSRIHTGTTNSANLLAVPAALEFHERISADAKQARVQYLRDLWVREVRELDRIQVLTPDDPRMYGSLTAFRIEGNTTKDQTKAIVSWLRDEKGILTVRRGGVRQGEVIRVTVAPWTTPEHCRKLTAALREASKIF